jgi:hypothetical protein
VTLLEQNRKLREENDQLKKDVDTAKREARLALTQKDDAEARCAKAEEEAANDRATAQQLLAAAAAWQTKLVDVESEHTMSAITEQAERSRVLAQNEAERLQLFSDLSSAQAERRVAEELARQTSATAETSRQLLEAQRDEALLRAGRAEDALSTSLHEQRTLTERLARATQHAAEEHNRRDASERKYARMPLQRCHEIATASRRACTPS